MAWIGVGFTFAFCYLLNRLVPRYSLKSITMNSLLIMSMSVLLTAIIPFEYSPWIFSIPAACGLATSYSALVSLFSQQVDASKQGWIMGLTGVISAASFAVTAALTGYLANIHINLPIYFSAIILFIAIFPLKKYIIQTLPEIRQVV